VSRPSASAPDAEAAHPPAADQTTREPHAAEPTRPVDLVVGALAAASVVTVWAVLVVLRPGTTFHFAPLLAPATGPVVMRLRTRRPLPSGWAAASAGTGVALTGLMAAALFAAGDLDGPTLWAAVSAPSEAVAFTMLGGLWGWRLASRRRPGLLFGHEQEPVSGR